jgi:hypothetical protein
MSVKSTYIHPHKKGQKISKITFKDLAAEENERTVAFYKRMVIVGGSIQKFKQGGADGISKNILIATAEDITKGVYTPNGIKDNQKVHDGAI